LSTEHSNCLQTLELYNSKSQSEEKLFMWVTHMEDYSSCDPCEPREHSTTNTLKVHNSISGSTPAQPTPADTWTYYHDGCMGGGDF
jgi:hypothetical protein